MPYKDPEKQALYFHEHYLRNKEKKLKYNKKYYEENKDEILSHNKEWAQAHPEVISKVAKKWRDANPEYEKTRHKEYAAANPAKIRERHLGYLGWTIEGWDKTYKEQGGVCAICGGLPSNGRNLSADHDHDSNTPRGLLCNDCNFMLGNAKDNPVILETGAAYLRKFGK